MPVPEAQGRRAVGLCLGSLLAAAWFPSVPPARAGRCAAGGGDEAGRPPMPLVLSLDRSRAAASPIEPPPWVPHDLWRFHRLPLVLPVGEGIGGLESLAVVAEDFRKATVFLRVRCDDALRLDLMAPGASWKLTGLGEFPEGDGDGEGGAVARRASPLLPQTLPRALLARRGWLLVAQLADLAPSQDGPQPTGTTRR